jgi:crotonobetainyl-CoA:carnitine CoA-transferase CaiB-like acyl-CoA transferase
MPAGANRPLAGVTVLDFGQVYQGPYATLLMAKAGADVIKIEPPQGEPLRRRAPPGKSTTFPIAMLSSNKRAITLNLKHDRLALRLDPFRRGRGPPARDSRR